MEALFITYQQSTISYRRFGHGNRILFCFHGYGEHAASFLFLESFLSKEFTCFALDFPFHGSTDWKEDLLFSSADLINIINLISTPDQKISLLGYSMGGRVTLQLLQIIPDRIEQLILIAPDGLHNNIWHKLSTQTSIGNKLFHYTMHQPNWMFELMKIFYSAGIINKSIYNFVHYYLDDPSSRLLLYKRWTTMRKFHPSLPLLKKIIPEKKISVKMMFGKYDRVIITKRGLAFQKNIAEWIIVKEIEAGHQLLRPKYAADIAALFQS